MAAWSVLATFDPSASATPTSSMTIKARIPCVLKSAITDDSAKEQRGGWWKPPPPRPPRVSQRRANPTTATRAMRQHQKPKIEMPAHEEGSGARWRERFSSSCDPSPAESQRGPGVSTLTVPAKASGMPSPSESESKQSGMSLPPVPTSAPGGPVGGIGTATRV